MSRARSSFGARPPSAGRWLRTGAVVATTIVAMTAFNGCGVPEDASDRPVNKADVQFGLLDPIVTTTSTTTTTTRLPPPSIPRSTTTLPAFWLDLYLVQNQKLVGVRRPIGVESTVAAVLDALQHPTPEEMLGGRRSELTDAGLVLSASSGGGSANVELGESFTSLLGSNQQLAIGQIVYSLTEVAGIGSVAFSLGGSALEVPGIDGGLISGPISRDDLVSLVAESTSSTSTSTSTSIELPPR